jgi:nitroreductase
MTFRELMERNRSRRKFDESRPVSAGELAELVDLVRFMPSGRNLQPLKYIVTADPAQCTEIFPLLGWAGYLTDWKGPAEGERPTGYIIMLLDKDLADTPHCDHGIACQSLMLGAVEKGYGGCIIATVLALGVPAQEVVLESLPSDGSIKYWTGEDGKHHVPKRGLDEILVGRFPKD